MVTLTVRFPLKPTALRESIKSRSALAPVKLPLGSVIVPEYCADNLPKLTKPINNNRVIFSNVLFVFPLVIVITSQQDWPRVGVEFMFI